ncbi:MAG TPA: bifunctional oligoribonuclease/PAP phosphatase NrnA [Mariniphaga anaerophila]|uniref:Bifunctional oligoribonuclease/PAP phosphatase NrnA n=1 Tax=Mariniphaga anaerophila TaxID=1484053 RepID=A0A831LMM3_9BACT|nr:bifunctional oligoribonuclease/PAP phosphatase NrnA [Mariniphaga anaerophila]
MVLKNTGNETFTSLRGLLANRPQKVALITHENPDGDAIGSAIGFGEVLQNFGHFVKIIVPNDYPSFLQWFSTEIEIINYERKNRRTKALLKETDVLVCLDFNDAKRAARLKKKLLEFSNPKVLIDHHPHPVNFCDYMVSEPEYSSTAELVFDVVQQIGLAEHINHDAAEALFAGIMTDTGSFAHNISRPNTFQVVAQLMEWGINTEKIHAAVYHNFSANRMKLLGHCLGEKMEVFPEFRSAVIWLSQEELKAFDFKPGDTEGFVNYPLSIQNIVFSALFIEKKDHIKASFRSKGSFPANEFSRDHFSGGGHRNAAGGEIKLTLDEAVEKFRQLLGDYEHLLKETTI